MCSRENVWRCVGYERWPLSALHMAPGTCSAHSEAQGAGRYAATLRAPLVSGSGVSLPSRPTPLGKAKCGIPLRPLIKNSILIWSVVQAMSPPSSPRSARKQHAPQTPGASSRLGGSSLAADLRLCSNAIEVL